MHMHGRVIFESCHTYAQGMSHVARSYVACVAVCCSVLPRVAACCCALQCVPVRCSALQCVAVRCSVLQCVAACCSVLQYTYAYAEGTTRITGPN